MEEYHKALECCDKAKKSFPEVQKIKNIEMKVMTAVQFRSRKNEEERVKHAYADPEIQALIKDNYLKIYKKIHKALMKLLWKMNLLIMLLEN